ncbi:MAG: hypothetical protein ACKOPM_06755, partial [Novosphingobium sp.]
MPPPPRRNPRPIDASRLEEMALAYVARFATARRSWRATSSASCASAAGKGRVIRPLRPWSNAM